VLGRRRDPGTGEDQRGPQGHRQRCPVQCNVLTLGYLYGSRGCWRGSGTCVQPVASNTVRFMNSVQAHG
jgi:hypothetical protein